MEFLFFPLTGFFLLLTCSSAAVPSQRQPSPFGRVNNSSVPFQAGFLLAQSAQRETEAADGQFPGQTAENEEIFGQSADLDCQQKLTDRVQRELEEGGEGIEFGGNLLAQMLGRREQVCRIFSSQSGPIAQCLGQTPGGIHPLLLILQSICGQFTEALDAHGQCMAELQLTRLEGQCAQACHRQAQSANSFPNSFNQSMASPPSSSGSAALCQLALCAINCFGAQISECAEEAEPKGDPAVLKALADQLAGLQMLLGMGQAQPVQAVQAQLIGGQVPAGCAQLIGKAVSSANFVAPHEPEPQAADGI